ncbi:MAG: gluconokinase [Magnetococcus sp. MYC-9]
MIIILMGVSGVGKSTVGALLAQKLGMPFIEADDYHTAANVKKMQSGIPLTDADRLPWLHTLADTIRHWQERGESGVLACSALKESYREILGNAEQGVRYVCLLDSANRIRARLTQRQGHFMPPSLLDSQLATLEVPTEAIQVSAAQPPERIAAIICQRLGPVSAP